MVDNTDKTMVGALTLSVLQDLADDEIKAMRE